MDKEKIVGDIKVTASENSYFIDVKEPEKIAQLIFSNAIFREKWITSLQDKEQQLEKFEPGRLETSLETNLILNKLFSYVTRLSHITIFKNNDLDCVSSEIHQEFEKENENGTLCIYASVLLFLLINKLELKARLSFIQGFYSMIFPEQTLQRHVIGGRGIGIHAYLLMNNTIIDPTIQQIGDNYYLGDSEFIVVGNNMPENIEMFGWREKQEIVYKYAEGYAIRRGLKINEWLATHVEAANKFSCLCDRT